MCAHCKRRGRPAWNMSLFEIPGIMMNAIWSYTPVTTHLKPSRTRALMSSIEYAGIIMWIHDYLNSSRRLTWIFTDSSAFGASPMSANKSTLSSSNEARLLLPEESGVRWTNLLTKSVRFRLFHQVMLRAAYMGECRDRKSSLRVRTMYLGSGRTSESLWPFHDVRG